MRSLSLPASIIFTTLILANYAANAQTSGYAPMSGGSATMQAPETMHPPAAINSAKKIGPYNAPGSMIDSVGDGAIPALPLEVQNSNGISYINGGVGDEEVAELKSKEQDFNVHVLVSAPQGEFISDVTLTVTDSKGQSLLTVNDAGPYFYAQLLPGTYMLQGTAGGEKKNISIKVPKSGAIKKQLSFGEAGGITTSHHPTATID